MRQNGNNGERQFDVPCTIDLENTPESLHAYVDIGTVEIGPGDRVLVHNAPSTIAFGERRVIQSTATVIRAGGLTRLATKIAAYLELTELYEVGFEAAGGES
ncbi:hypothetical protein [Phreatobacter sp.]|uniref:hypothetical protein n=1 Tax=Phreatobacter sp. TaxID=1966341 RepID=UPI003F72756A